MLHIQPTNDPQLLAVLNRQVQDLHASMHPTLFKPFEQESVAEFFRKVLESPQNLGYVAYEEEVPVGFMILMLKVLPENAFKYAGSVLHIDQIGVQASHRGKGISKRLLEKAIEVADAHGIQRIELDHWSSNQVAKAAFEALGFQTFREHKYLQL